MSTNPTRDLPDEQRKTADVNDDENLDLQTMERANDIAQQYETIKDRTVDDDTVLGRIIDINTSVNNSRIIIEVAVPGEGTAQDFRFRKPKVWSEEYKFVRWLHHYGYDADTIPNMLKDECKVRVSREEKGSYNLYVPEYDAPIRAQLKEKRTAFYKWYLTSNFTFWVPLLVGWFLVGIALLSDIIPNPVTGKQMLGLMIMTLIIIVMILHVEESHYS